MAAVSALSGSREIVSSHQAQQREQDQWDLGSNDSLRNGEQYVNGYGQQTYDAVRLDDPERSTSLETSKSSRTGKKIDQSYLLPYKQGARPDLGGSRSGSEPDSLIDLYGHPRSIAERSLDSSRRRSGTHESLDNEETNHENENEQSSWIHRDKLALIESQEMQAAGIVPPLPRTTSKSRHRREKSEDQNMQGVVEPDDVAIPTKAGKKRKVKQIPKEQELEHEIPINEFDVRTPEEIAEDSYMERSPSPIYRQQTARSSSSRIPLPRSSPMPLPQEHLERTTPLPRKRNASGTWSGGDEDTISYNRLRSRGNSVGSQVLLDDVDGPHSPVTPGNNSRPTSSGSPSKNKVLGGTKPSHGRKSSTSTPNSNQKPRSTSTPRSPSNPLQRPKSRSGLEPRPPTAINRPEGEAPWLKDMYKPDPRLPPDQQLLPTHAKRLQEEQKRQEQWDQAQHDSEVRRSQRGEAESKGHSPPQNTRPDAPQSDFSPLAVHTRNGLQPTSSSTRDGGTGDEQVPFRAEPGTEWPLAHGSVRSGSNSERNGVGGVPMEKATNAGYSPMPRIRSGQSDGGEPRAPVTGLRQPGDHQGREAPLDPFEKERLARAQEVADNNGDSARKKKEKGCGCCVVM